MDFMGDRKMILLGTAIAFCGVVCLLVPAKTEMLAIAGFIVIGLGFAPIYPCIIHSTPSNFGAENSGAIIGIQMASAYVGSTFMPPLYGLLGKWLGYGMMPIYILLFMTLMFCMTEKTFKMTK
jgi:MFS family permease